MIIPAIDLKKGRCVRLVQGDFAREKVYSERPDEIARHWVQKGAERLHIVDLDGALHGRPLNGQVIRSIVRAAGVPVQLGGGIRDLDTIAEYLDLGVSFVILGTLALRDRDLFRRACEEYPDKLILGLDARKNSVAVQGWTEKTSRTPLELVKEFEVLPLAGIVYTDIERDGMGAGPNIEATRQLASSTTWPVILSGGISGLEDVRKILPLEEFGVIGAITGRALYEGTLDLEEAIGLAKKYERGRPSRP